MRQAANTTTAISAGVFFLGLSLAAHVHADGSDSAAALAQAKRLIDARELAPAALLLEDRLLDADPRERPAIVALLRRTYEVMAREAKAAGRDRDAAHFQDNLAIIARIPGAEGLAKPSGSEPVKPSPAPQSKPSPAPQSIKKTNSPPADNGAKHAPGSAPEAARPVPAPSPSPALALQPAPASPSEPLPLAEPSNAPAQARCRFFRNRRARQILSS